MLFDRCPPEEALAAFVAGVTSPKIERHVAHCEACAQIVGQFRQDEAWLQNVRRAAQELPEDSDTGRSDENPPIRTATCLPVMLPSPVGLAMTSLGFRVRVFRWIPPPDGKRGYASNDSNQETL